MQPEVISMTNKYCNPIALHRSTTTIPKQMSNQVVRKPFAIDLGTLLMSRR